YGGISVGAGVSYDVGAGLKFDFQHEAAQYDFDYGMNIDGETSQVVDVLNGSPWIRPFAVQNGDALMVSTGGTPTLSASSDAFVKADPNGHFNLWGGVGFLLGDAGFDIGGPFDLPLIDAGIDPVNIHLKSGDDIVKLADDYKGLAGFLNIGVPGVIDTQGDS